MAMNWTYVTEQDKDKKGKDVTNHLWYISLDLPYDPGFEGEITSVGDGPFTVCFYEQEQQKSKLKFKTLAAAKKKLQSWIVKKLTQEASRIFRLTTEVRHIKTETRALKFGHE
jgi:hypothetical protein